MAVYVKNDIKSFERSHLDSDLESVSIELNIKYSKPIIVITINRRARSRFMKKLNH